eukprot:11041322-Ditylum_brightwellii.AAC.1
MLGRQEERIFQETGSSLEHIIANKEKKKNYMPYELEAESFWDCLCDESVWPLKAAFMDALAAKSQGCDTASLGNGVWELCLVDCD